LQVTVFVRKILRSRMTNEPAFFSQAQLLARRNTMLQPHRPHAKSITITRLEDLCCNKNYMLILKLGTPCLSPLARAGLAFPSLLQGSAFVRETPCRALRGPWTHPPRR